jgi:hypothetical protein
LEQTPRQQHEGQRAILVDEDITALQRLCSFNFQHPENLYEVKVFSQLDSIERVIQTRKSRAPGRAHRSRRWWHRHFGIEYEYIEADRGCH